MVFIQKERVRRKERGMEGGSRVGAIVGVNIVEEIWSNLFCKLCTFMRIRKSVYFSGNNLNKVDLTFHIMFLYPPNLLSNYVNIMNIFLFSLQKITFSILELSLKYVEGCQL